VNGLIDFALIIAIACLFVAGVAAYFRHHEIADANRADAQVEGKHDKR
jgi:hypothetical protein